MNTLFYVHGLLDELRIAERADNPDEEFFAHLDELIMATIDALRDQGRERREVRSDPSLLHERQYTDRFRELWSRRVKETIGMVKEYQGMPEGGERDRMRMLLKERHLPV
jgi:hypothetical protein